MKTSPLLFVLFFIVFSYSPLLSAQTPYGNAGDHTPVILGRPETPFGYYEYLPTSFDASSSTTYPLVLFYHGLGEKGNGTTELNKVLANGPPKLIEQGTDFEAIIISPQSAYGWFSPANFLSLYTYLTAHYPIDTNRVYVTGLSAGGGGTWNALKGHHEKIAAALPICGAGSVSDPAAFLQQTPIRAHHNFNDGVVGKGQTINNMNRIANTGSSVMSVYPYGSSNSVADADYSMQFDTNTQTWSASVGIHAPNDKLSFTLYKNGNHDAWTKTYNNQEVWDWLFAQRLNTLGTNDDNLEISFKIYPNPTSNKATIITANTTEKKVEIYNLLGTIIYSHVLFKELDMNVSTYASGVYIVKVSDANNNQKTIRIIVN
ncbi:T9SS type A sorting domain-containing protein [Lacinutrix neustonica]|uniref:T9SS type A sorting domain-containing protein n=1 Tax=Lacinutrix neustonica TaxID=2980107 RepID=A0A9E8MV79_9FLAO|nr:T9SS type A sorting domain-containing protein [Lacinutrix neustonica]WAC00930.1 T9SS type A sorting domain-containing protein [Lacinutrix neustonica]